MMSLEIRSGDLFMDFILTRKAGLLKHMVLHPQSNPFCNSQSLPEYPEKLPWWYCQVIETVTNTEGKDFFACFCSLLK